MHRLLLSLALMTLSTSKASNPAPLNGIWKLTSSTLQEMPATVMPEMFIVSGSVHGQLGCGRFTGTIEAQQGHVGIEVSPLPPEPTEKCLNALPNEFHAALNTVNRYVISRDTKKLVLLNAKTRLTFERIGYVTPAKK